MITRGDIYFADLNPGIGSEQMGLRPVLVVQNDVGNKYSPTVIVTAITSKTDKNRLPTHIGISASGHGLERDSVILAEQIRTLDKSRLRDKMGQLPPEVMAQVDQALQISLGMATT